MDAYLWLLPALLPAVTFFWSNCPCCGTDTQICSTLVMPYGFDVIVPAISGCIDPADPSLAPIDYCACEMLPGTHKVFRSDYVARYNIPGACDWVLVGGTRSCIYQAVGTTTLTVRESTFAPPCSDSGAPTRKVYIPQWFVAGFCSSDGVTWSVEPFCHDPDAAWRVINRNADQSNAIDLRVAGTGIPATPYKLRVLLVTLYRTYTAGTCEPTTGANQGFSGLYESAPIAADADITAMGLISLSVVTGSGNAPMTIHVQANSMAIPT